MGGETGSHKEISLPLNVIAAAFQPTTDPIGAGSAVCADLAGPARVEKFTENVQVQKRMSLAVY